MRPRRIARPFTGTYIQTQQSEERSGKQKQKQQQQQQHDGGSLAADVRRKPRFTVLSASTRLIRFSCRQPPSRKAGSALRGNVNTHTHTRQRERRNRKSQGVEKNVTTRSVATQNSRESAQVLSARAPGWYYCVFLSFFFFLLFRRHLLESMTRLSETTPTLSSVRCLCDSIALVATELR